MPDEFTNLIQDPKPIGEHNHLKRKEVDDTMRGPLDTMPAGTGNSEVREEQVNVWSDSVGAAARQLGVLVAVVFAARLASHLLFGN